MAGAGVGGKLAPLEGCWEERGGEEGRRRGERRRGTGEVCGEMGVGAEQRRISFGKSKKRRSNQSSVYLSEPSIGQSDRSRSEREGDPTGKKEMVCTKQRSITTGEGGGRPEGQCFILLHRVHFLSNIALGFLVHVSTAHVRAHTERHTHTMHEAKRRSSAMLRTALAACGLQLLSSIPTAGATAYGARRSLYFQDADCRLETFREFAYDALSIEMDGVTSQGARGSSCCCLAALLPAVYFFCLSTFFFPPGARFWPLMTFPTPYPPREHWTDRARMANGVSMLTPINRCCWGRAFHLAGNATGILWVWARTSFGSCARALNPPRIPPLTNNLSRSPAALFLPETCPRRPSPCVRLLR